MSPVLALPALFASVAVLAQPVSATWTRETQPTPRSGPNAVQDVALWVNPADAGASLLLTADTQAGLVTFGLDGQERELRVTEGIVSSVAVREDFPLGSVSQQLVLSANPSLNGLVAYVVDPVTLTLRPVSTAFGQPVAYTTVRLYRSPLTGRFFAFAGGADGVVRQFELTGADGGVTATPVRNLTLGGSVGGIVADEGYGALFVLQPGQGIFRFLAEPDAPTTGQRLEGSTALSSTAGRMDLYAAPGNEGYLLVADTGANAFAVFDRRSFALVGSFQGVAPDGGTDRVDAPRGLAVYPGRLTSDFPEGLFVAHDAIHSPVDNLKLIPWGSVARAFNPPLRIAGQQQPADGGTDGGTDGGGGTGTIGGGGGSGGPKVDEGGCSCTAVSVPAVTLFGLLAVVLAGRRRRS